MTRWIYFGLVNIAIMVMLSIAGAIIGPLLGPSFQEALPIFGQFSYFLPICLVWGFGGAFISLYMSKFLAKKFMGVEVIDPQTTDPELRQLVDMVHRMSKKAGLTKMPEVGYYNKPEINAFATGPSKNNSLVAVSSGLLQSMNTREVEGVIGHEVAHIANGDMVTMTLIQGVVNSFVYFFARIVGTLVGAQVDQRFRFLVEFVVTILFQIIFGLLGTIVVSYFSRKREFRADQGGARYAGKENMIQALQALQRTQQYATAEAGQGDDYDQSIASLKISSRPQGLMQLFSTHPPLEARIAKLQRASLRA